MKTWPLKFYLLGTVLLAALALQGGAEAQPTVTVRYLCLPHHEPPIQPTEKERKEFQKDYPDVKNKELEQDPRFREFIVVKRINSPGFRKDVMENRAKELLQNIDFAWSVLGQRQVFSDIKAFEKSHPGVRVRVCFIPPEEWFARLKDEVSRPSNTPFVCQVGDTWLAYFEDRGAVVTFVRHFNDVRLLWFSKKWVSPEEIRDEALFRATCLRLKQQGLVPWAIPTFMDWDLLWNFYVLLNSAGGELVRVGPKYIVFRHWKEAVVDQEPGLQVARFLMDLVESGCLALPEVTNLQVTEDFLNGKYAMIVMEPWVAWMAEKRWGPAWTQHIGATLPPTLGDNTEPATFLGGSLLVVMDPTKGQQPKAVQAASEFMRFLASGDVQERHIETLQFLPNSPKAWKSFRFQKIFQPGIDHGQSPPRFPEWPEVVENPAVRDSLYWFWKRLAVLPRAEEKVDKAYRQQQRAMVLETLHSAARMMNEGLDPGRWQHIRWWAAAVILLLATFAGYAFWRRHIERRWLAELKARREEIEQARARLRDVFQIYESPIPSAGVAPGEPTDFDSEIERLRALIKSGNVSIPPDEVPEVL